MKTINDIKKLTITAAEGKIVFTEMIENKSFTTVEDMVDFFKCVAFPTAGYNKHFIDAEIENGDIIKVKYCHGADQPGIIDHINYYLKNN